MIADTFNQKADSNVSQLSLLIEEGLKNSLDASLFELNNVSNNRVYVDGFSLGVIPLSNENYDWLRLPVIPVVPTIEDFKDICDEDGNPNYPLGEFDATKWAPEFKKIGIKLGYLTDDISDAPGDWLHTWFCAAIMTGYDHAMCDEAFKELDEWEEELLADEYCFWGV